MAALALGACGAGSHLPAPRPVAATLPPVGHRVPAHRARPKPPSPELRALRAALAAKLKRLAAGAGAVVYDLSSHQLLFALHPDVRRPPASVEKLYTSVAVLKRLGRAATLTTRIMGVGHLGGHGIWDGDLYLRGGGDPTFGDGTFVRDWDGGSGTTPNQLAAQLAAHGIRRVSGRVVGDASLFDSRTGGPSTNYAADIPDIGGELAGLTYDHGGTAKGLSPGAFAARELVLTMRKLHISARARRSTQTTPPGATALASISSPPMSTLLRLMNVPSDDFFAEMLAKQLGARFGGGGSTAGGARVIRSVLATYGLAPAIVDGSGLSRSDASSPMDIVKLLRLLWHTPVGDELSSTLPTVGETGTVATIGLHTPAQNHCLAKTGTLDNVTNLAGYCASHGGHMLAFALFLDGPGNWQAIPILSAMVGDIARY